MLALYNSGLTNPNKGLPAAKRALFMRVINPAMTKMVVVKGVVYEGRSREGIYSAMAREEVMC